MFLKRGCWHPLPGSLGLPFRGGLAKPGQALVVCPPQATPAMIDLHLPPGDHLPGVQQELSSNPPRIWGKWLDSGEQQTIRGFQLPLHPALIQSIAEPSQ